jgi:hypothetical protein
MKIEYFVNPEKGTVDKLMLNMGESPKVRYYHMRYKGKLTTIHRIIWSHVNGPIPSNMVIDHINGDTHDNRIVNLRLVTQKINCQNRRYVNKVIPQPKAIKPKKVKVEPLPKERKKSGVKGIHWYDPLKKWRAGYTINNKWISLGYHLTVEEAQTAISNNTGTA